MKLTRCGCLWYLESRKEFWIFTLDDKEQRGGTQDDVVDEAASSSSERAPSTHGLVCVNVEFCRVVGNFAVFSFCRASVALLQSYGIRGGSKMLESI